MAGSFIIVIALGVKSSLAGFIFIFQKSKRFQDESPCFGLFLFSIGVVTAYFFIGLGADIHIDLG